MRRLVAGDDYDGGDDKSPAPLPPAPWTPPMATNIQHRKLIVTIVTPPLSTGVTEKLPC